MMTRVSGLMTKTGRGQGWDGLIQAIQKSYERHPPIEAGGIDQDHCKLCNEKFHELRMER